VNNMGFMFNRCSEELKMEVKAHNKNLTEEAFSNYN